MAQSQKVGVQANGLDQGVRKMVLKDFRVSLIDALMYEEDIEQRCLAEGTRYLPAQADVYKRAFGLSSRLPAGKDLCASLVDLFLSLDGIERYGGIVLHSVCLELDRFLASHTFRFEWDGLQGRTKVTWILMMLKEDRLQAYKDYPEHKF